MHDQIAVPWIIGLKMDGVIMRSIHTGVHHENAGFDCRAFTGLENHRTDGQFRRSATLQHFDVGLLFEAQRSIPGIGDLDSK